MTRPHFAVLALAALLGTATPALAQRTGWIYCSSTKHEFEGQKLVVVRNYVPESAKADLDDWPSRDAMIAAYEDAFRAAALPLGEVTDPPQHGARVGCGFDDGKYFRYGNGRASVSFDAKRNITTHWILSRVPDDWGSRVRRAPSRPSPVVARPAAAAPSTAPSAAPSSPTRGALTVADNGEAARRREWQARQLAAQRRYADQRAAGLAEAARREASLQREIEAEARRRRARGRKQ